MSEETDKTTGDNQKQRSENLRWEDLVKTVTTYNMFKTGFRLKSLKTVLQQYFHALLLFKQMKTNSPVG